MGEGEVVDDRERERFDRYLRTVRQRVGEYGWIVQGELPRAGAVVQRPALHYTVGLTMSGLPELAVLDVSPAPAKLMLDLLAVRARHDDLPVNTWFELVGFNRGVSVRVEESSLADELVVAGRLYGGRVRRWSVLYTTGGLLVPGSGRRGRRR